MLISVVINLLRTKTYLTLLGLHVTLIYQQKKLYISIITINEMLLEKKVDNEIKTKVKVINP